MAESEEIRTARRALGRRLADYRQAAGLSQHQLAPQTFYGRSTVANVEVGRQSVPRHFWERADAALGAAGSLTAQYDELVSLVQQPRQSARGSAVSREAGWGQDDGVFGGLLGRSVAVLDQDRPAASGVHEEMMSTTVIAGADRLLRLFLQLDAEVGGDDLYEPMTRPRRTSG